MTKRTHKDYKRAERLRRVEAGFFDGRFGTRKTTNTKRAESKKACRNYKYTQ